MDPELIAELKRLEELMTGPEPVFEYRWYYDETGRITHLASHCHPPGDNYIVVSEELYNHYNDYFVKNQQPRKQNKNFGIIKFGLFKSAVPQGQTVVKNHASLVVEDHENYEQIEDYDARTS